MLPLVVLCSSASVLGAFNHEVSLRALAILTLALAFTCVPRAQAESYRFVTLDFPPLAFATTQDTADGAAVAIVREVMLRLGQKVTIEVLPWTRSLGLVKEGKADAIFTAYRNADRELFLDYSREPLIEQVVSLYVHHGSTLKFDGHLAHLKSHSIGIVSTISYGGVFDLLRDGLTTERVESQELNFKKLAAGRVEYVISNRYTAQVEITALGLEDVVEELAPAVEVIPSFIGFSKQNKLSSLRDHFDQALRALRRSGKYNEILKKYKVRAPTTHD